MRTIRFVLGALALALGATAVTAAPAAAHTGYAHASLDDRGFLRPVLEQRATLSADYIAPGPPSGALVTPANGRTGPFAGQVIPGFSGVVDNHDGTFLAMPDNGFGTKANSADFLLRLYTVVPDWQTRRGGPGAFAVPAFVSLRDPDGKVPWTITNGSTADRLLTGADFDIESVQRARDGSLWIGEEFGPFLLHFDATGKLLDAPVPFAGGKSPQNPTLGAGEAPRVRQSRGFEAMAQRGRFLYPIVEGSYLDDTDLRRREVFEFDTRTNRYTGRTWQYRTDADANVIGDAQFVDANTIVLIERDDFEGARSVTKKLYTIDLRKTGADGFLMKRQSVDLLRIDNPNGIGTGRPAGAQGLGDPFAFALQSVETVVLLDDGRILVANDNNYPGSNGRVAGTPDDTELIVFRLERSDDRALVIGHRGASGSRPEHTLAAYDLAIQQCAEYIEPDLVSTKDGVLVARHENEISGTTDVSTRPEFASRRTTKVIDGVSVTGWFTEDLTLAELKTLRAIERIPAIRPANTAFDGRFEVPTLQEVVDLAQRSISCAGREIGIYPETKHPTYFDSIGLSLEEPLLAALDANGYRGRNAKVFVQSFEVANLKELATRTRVRLVQLVNCSGRPYDFTVAGDTRTYADLATPAGLREIRRYADGVGICKDVMIPRSSAGDLLAPTSVIADAHAAGLVVHGWTFRLENAFLPLGMRSSTVPSEPGNLPAEIRAFVGAGMDGFFTDHPIVGAATVAAIAAEGGRARPWGLDAP
jgi:glycerophosphoryl diester phosphodiesterase